MIAVRRIPTALIALLTAIVTTAATTVSSTAGVAQEETKIVYTRASGQEDIPRRHEVFIMGTDGTDAVRLTNNVREDAFPTLTPDGSRIAFSQKIRGQHDLFIMDADGSDLIRVTRSAKGDEVIPTWSPDGAQLAFTATTSIPDGGWQSDIYAVRLTNGRFRRLTFTPTAKEFAPDWAPDGSEIAFTKQNYRREKYGVASVRPDSQGLHWVVVNPRSRDGYTDVNPSWSPDSEWLAFSRDHEDDAVVDIYKVRRDGSELSAITQLQELAENPVWGADDRILFMHDQGIAVVATEGSEVDHLTPTKTGLPYWWPDW